MTAPPPYALLAELTHRCPLHCAYCSNPLDLVARQAELPTSTWLRVLSEAADLGVVQVHLSGGEPLVRSDLEEIAANAARLQLYTQVTTSGVGLDALRARRLAESGVLCVQLSIQAHAARLGDRIAGYRAHHLKEKAAAAVRAADLSLTLNVVLNRLNIDSVADIIDLALSWGADRLELANTQYYHWALLNRSALLPTVEQVRAARDVVAQRRAVVGARMAILWVDPDYISGTPKPCMGGWGRVSMTVAPDGRALPCPAAQTIRALRFDFVQEWPLRRLWDESPAFKAFRGFSWMREPCAGCPKQSLDFGGCRCQSFALTGDASATDPVCSLSPHHSAVADAVAAAAAATGSPATSRLHYRMYDRRGRASTPIKAEL